MKKFKEYLFPAIFAVALLAIFLLKNNNCPCSSVVADDSVATLAQKVENTLVISDEEDVKAKKLPKLIDLGAKRCIPCKMMAPILDELKNEYAGIFEVEFVDVWQRENIAIAEKYKIESIPTQIFLDGDGKELFRHVGYYSKENILSKWKELGVDISKKSAQDSKKNK